MSISIKYLILKDTKNDFEYFEFMGKKFIKKNI